MRGILRLWRGWSGLLVSASLFALGATPLTARPDFSTSEIVIGPTPVRAGEVARFKVVARNRGDTAAASAELRLQWPLMGHLIEVRGVDGVQLDHDARTATVSFPLGVGESRELEVFVLAPRDSAGDALSVSVRLIDYSTMSETWFHQSLTVDSRPRTDVVRIGGLLIAPAGLAVLAWLVLAGLGLAFAGWFGGAEGAGRFFSPRAGVMAILVALGFWMVFAAMAWRDWSILMRWRASTATIIGRRVTIETVETTQRRGSGSGTTTGSSEVAKPEFALRYEVDGREMLSTGYDTGSSLRVGGGRAQLEREFREWTIGAKVPCWYDPGDPGDVVLKRGFGGAYVFALLPLIPFAMGLAILRRGGSQVTDDKSE